MDDVEKIARTATDVIESVCQAERLIWSLGSGKAKDVADRIFAAHLRTYGDQCRRAGAEAASPAAGWRPMDGSPRDGTFYLGAYKGRYHPKIVCEDEDGFWWDDQGGQAHAPMAWMPLPSPPVLPLKKESPSPSEEARAG